MKSRRDWDCGGLDNLGSGTVGSIAAAAAAEAAAVEVLVFVEVGGTEEIRKALSVFLSNIRSRAVSHFISVGKGTLKGREGGGGVLMRRMRKKRMTNLKITDNNNSQASPFIWVVEQAI